MPKRRPLVSRNAHSIPQRLSHGMEPDMVDRVRDAAEAVGQVFGLGTLELPAHFTAQGDDAMLHLHRHGIIGHRHVPEPDVEHAACDLAVGSLLIGLRSRCHGNSGAVGNAAVNTRICSAMQRVSWRELSRDGVVPHFQKGEAARNSSQDSGRRRSAL